MNTKEILTHYIHCDPTLGDNEDAAYLVKNQTREEHRFNSVYRLNDRRVIVITGVGLNKYGDQIIQFNDNTHHFPQAISTKEFNKLKPKFLAYRPHIIQRRVRPLVDEVTMYDERVKPITSEFIMIRFDDAYHASFVFRNNKYPFHERYEEKAIKRIIELVNKENNLNYRANKYQLKSPEDYKGEHTIQTVKHSELTSKPMLFKLLGPNHPVIEEIESAKARREHYNDDWWMSL